MFSSTKIAGSRNTVLLLIEFKGQSASNATYCTKVNSIAILPDATRQILQDSK